MRLAGARYAGGRALVGRVRNFSVRSVRTEVLLSWDHEVTAVEPNVVFAVVLDGETVAVLSGDVREYSLAGIALGAHRVEVIPVRGDAVRIPDFHGEDYGRRAWVFWPAATSSDCREYRVYTDGGTGTVNSSTAVGVVNRTAIHELFRQEVDGDGTGRVSVFGIWRGGKVNSQFTIAVGAGGTFRHNVSGSWSAWRLIERGALNDLENGVQARFDDDVSAYESGDELLFRVGPRTWWLSGELAEGTHKFTVRAADAAGNVTSTISETTVVIIHKPDDVVSPAVSWDGEDIALSWTLPEDPDIDAVLIYSNWSNTFGRLRDYVLEDGPWVVKAGDATSHSFTPAESGVWRFYIRTRDSDGRVSDSVELLTVDTSVDLPTGTPLREPEALTVTPIAAGGFRLSWKYPLFRGRGVEEFAILESTETEDPEFDETETVAAGIDTKRETGTVDYSVDMAGPYSATTYFTVRARTATGIETTNRELVAGVPDATAPTFSGAVRGVAN